MSVNIKLAKVVKCDYVREWENPMSKKMIYYHDIITDMGDVLNYGTMIKNSPRIKKGAMIEFTIDEKGKMKLLSSSNDKAKIAETAIVNRLDREKNFSSKAASRKEPTAYMGFAWSYAKDFVIAGKTMKDIDELNQVARYIYSQMGKMLNNEEE